MSSLLFLLGRAPREKKQRSGEVPASTRGCGTVGVSSTGIAVSCMYTVPGGETLAFLPALSQLGRFRFRACYRRVRRRSL